LYSGRLCADTLQRHQDDFAPFCEYSDAVTSFDQYIDRVRNSADWGGHLELRALSIALERPMLIYQAQSAEPLLIESSLNADKPIRLSYHRHYYALGEHYNRVVAQTDVL
jgi:OTU domain-containing protein 6